jgi:hypothetical protein
MNEAAVKAQVLSHIRQASGRRKPILTAELTLGTSGTRADVAVLADAELIGLEIKTERDSLRRLPAQLEAYSRYFDHVVVVTAPCHFAELAELDIYGASVWRSTKGGCQRRSDSRPARRSKSRPVMAWKLICRGPRSGPSAYRRRHCLDQLGVISPVSGSTISVAWFCAAPAVRRRADCLSR